MTQATERKANAGEPLWAGAIVVAAILLWLVFRHVPPVPDSAWLMEGARRWLNGATLFVDVREINPPLIFYDIVGLSFGTANSAAFAGGVALATMLSSLWIGRHHGMMIGLGVFVSISAAGMVEFGQREHLMLIFAAPYLLARGKRNERALMGLWAFFGIALKPHFLPIVVLPALLEAIRDWRSICQAQKVALGLACAVYLVAVLLIHPAYFSEMVPLAREVYSYGGGIRSLMLVETILIIALAAAARPEHRSLALAAVGAVLSYYLQFRYWPYHFIGAAGLGMILCLVDGRRLGWIILLAAQVVQGPYKRVTPTLIPEGVNRVAVLSIHPFAAYPTVTGCGAVNLTPWGSLGWVPGPWNTLTDPKSSSTDRAQAAATLRRERDRLRRYIIGGQADVIIADASPHKAYVDRPLDFMRLLGPIPGYRLQRRVGRYEYWSKKPLSERYCTERY